MPNLDDNNMTPPLGLLYIAAVLEEAGHKVSFLDARIQRDLIQKIQQIKPDILGITATTPAYKSGISIAKQVKDDIPDIKIVFGGPHPSSLPEETLMNECIDFVIIGEGEYPLRDLCNVIEKNGDITSISNLYYKDNEKIKFTGKTHILTEQQLDDLPIPAYHLLDIEKYFLESKSYGVFIKDSRNLPVITSRGCPSACTFCSRNMGNIFRGRSPASVVREIKQLVSTYHIGEIQIVDDNFTFKKDRAMRILEEIIEEDLQISIKFPNGLRADQTDPELFYKMKSAGVYAIGFGIESGSPRVLKLMKKGTNLDIIRKAVYNAKDAGILVSGAFILGYPGEKADDIRLSMEYALSLPLDSASIVSFVPLPGTEAYDVCKKMGYLTSEANDWDNFVYLRNIVKPLIETEFLTPDEISGYMMQFHLRFYLRPAYILRSIPNLSITQMIRGIKTIFFPFLPH